MLLDMSVSSDYTTNKILTHWYIPNDYIESSVNACNDVFIYKRAVMIASAAKIRKKMRKRNIKMEGSINMKNGTRGGNRRS